MRGPQPVSRRMLLDSLDDVGLILYRQAALADGIDQQETVRELYAPIVAALVAALQGGASGQVETMYRRVRGRRVLYPLCHICTGSPICNKRSTVSFP